jgi:hypothetical protein
MKTKRLMVPNLVKNITDIQSIGRYLGYAWLVTHYQDGFRAGFLRVIEGHPWFGLTEFHDDCFKAVHRGIDWYAIDKHLDEDQAEGWWLGFICGHYGDAPDLDLAKQYGIDTDPLAKIEGEVRSQNYVELNLIILAQEAFAAAMGQIQAARKKRKRRGE